MKNKTVPLVFDKGSPGRRGAAPPALDVPVAKLADVVDVGMHRRTEPAFPCLSEQEVLRHYHALSELNFSLDKGFYPLGSCTMKYNPRLNEELCRLPGFTQAHPLAPDRVVAGCIELLVVLQEMLCEITGMDAVSCAPSAGAHGEFAGLLIMRAALKGRGENRSKIIIPDSAHGTNPASVSLAGFKTVQIPSGNDGLVDLSALEKVLDSDVAGLMLTNPNTLGLFEKDISRISAMIHDVGGLLYYDGANLNAVMGISRPGDMGFDVVHLNLHKTFSTPHGGGGPGSGPVGVKKELEPYLPIPFARRDNEGNSFMCWDMADSIGKIGAFHGNFAVAVRALAYILSMGHENLPEVARNAVLNANYLLKLVSPFIDAPYGDTCMHEFVVSASRLKSKGVKALDLAKALLDMGYHAPTMYFPLIVDEALMIEPTETETREDIERFAAALADIVKKSAEDPEFLLNSPSQTPVTRVDEATAARKPCLRWRSEEVNNPS